MVEFFKSLYRYYKLRDLGALLVASMAGAVPFVGALLGLGFLAQAQAPLAGMTVFFAGFLVTGLVLSVSGRILDLRYRKVKPSKGAYLRALSAGWAEGLVLALVLVGLFAVVFNSVPFYWEQGGILSVVSLSVLGIGTLMVLAALPYFLPVRRRENLGLAASLLRAFRLMNTNLPLTGMVAGLGLLSLMATIGSFGLFPGFGGLAALHQAAYDMATSGRPEDPGTGGQ